MSGVLEELSKYLTVPFSEVLDFKYTVVSNNIISVTGYKKILNYSADQVVLSIKNNQLEISGKNLKIKELYKGNLVLVGNINKICLVKEFWYV